MVQYDAITRLRLQRGGEHLHRLGPRATCEVLCEISHRIGGMPAILGCLAEYEARLTPQLLRRAGGDRFPHRPLRIVPSVLRNDEETDR